MNTIDFIFIGAQKSGTTALHEYMKNHPSIILPKGKEAPFFNRDEYYKLGIAQYIQKTYPKYKKNGDLWGKISPQYMSNELISKRVLTSLPDAKLFAILRDPIQRAKSHYVMSVQRGLETRDINAAFEQLLNPGNLARSRELDSTQASESSCYIAWSEYGRILDIYQRLRPDNPPVVFYFEDMLENPIEFMKCIFDTLGVDRNYTSPIVGKQVFKSGENSLIKILKKISSNDAIRKMWRSIPVNIRSQMYFTVEQSLSKIKINNSQNEKVSTIIHPDLMQELKANFRADIDSSLIIKGHDKWSV